MKATLSICAAAVLSTFVTISPARADHHTNAWWEYLIGAWTVERSDGEKSEITYKLAPTGKALIGEWRDDEDSTTYFIQGYRDNKRVSTGYATDGRFWEITEATPSDDRSEGAMMGSSPDTGGWSGKYSQEKINENLWKWKIDAKTSQGEPILSSATMTRKK